MIAHLTVAILGLLLILFIPNKRKGLSWAFAMVTIFLSIRYMWGNDYLSYAELYQDCNNGDFSFFDFSKVGDLREGHKYEVGWVFLNRLFGFLGFGFFGLVIVLTVFENWAVHKMVVKYVEPQYYWVAFALYVFPAQFCINASMMRQYLCICIYMFVVVLMTEKKVRGYLWKSIALILLGVTFHQSNFILLITLPLYYVHIKQGSSFKWQMLIAVLFVVWFAIGRSSAFNNILKFLESTDDLFSYSHYMEEAGTGYSTIGAIYHYAMLLVWLIVLPQFEKDRQPIILLVIFSYFVEALSFQAVQMARFCAYFDFWDLIRWTWLLQMAKKNQIIYALFGLLIIRTIISIPVFYKSPVWSLYFFDYHTIFDAGGWF